MCYNADSVVGLESSRYNYDSTIGLAQLNHNSDMTDNASKETSCGSLGSPHGKKKKKKKKKITLKAVLASPVCIIIVLRRWEKDMS